MNLNVYRSITALCGAHLAVDFLLGVLPAYTNLAALDASRVGLLLGIAIFLGESLQILFGYLGDKGFERMFAPLGILFASTVFFLPYTSGDIALFAVILSTYLGSALFHPSGASLATGASKLGKGALTTLFITAGTLGAAFSQSGFTWAYTSLQGKTAFLYIPAALFAVALFAITSGMATQKQKRTGAIWTHAKAIAPLFGIQAIIQMVLISFMFLLPNVLEIRHFPKWFVLGGANFFFVIGAFSFGLKSAFFVDKVCSRKHLFSLLIGGGLIFYFFLLLSNAGLIVASTLLFSVGGLLGSVIPVALAAGQRQVPPESQSLIAGTLLGGAACLGGGGLVLASSLMRLFAAHQAENALLLIGSLLTLALVFVIFLEKKNSQTFLTTKSLLPHHRSS